jgi:hypothetical protein
MERKLKMQNPKVNAHTVAAAGRALGSFLIRHSHHIGRVLGFSYEPCEIAPDTLQLVKNEYRECLMQRRAFRVWSGGSDATVYNCPEANYAFRFWHDITHAQNNTAFDCFGEWKTARIQLRAVARAFGADSIESLVFKADTLGQTAYAQLTDGGFVTDQKGFVVYVAQRMAQGVPMQTAVSDWLAAEGK